MSDEIEGWPKESVKTALQQAADQLNKPPTKPEFDNIPGPHSTSVLRHYGSWNQALLSVIGETNQAFESDVPIPADVNHPYRTPYVKGFRARLEGDSRDSCPYADKAGGKVYGEVWKRGYDEAESWVSEIQG